MASRLQKIQDLFEKAAEIPPESRREFLITAASGDETLIEEVEELLRHDAQANDSLFVSLDQAASEAFSDKPRRETIGKYRIVRELGQGGMGTVYLAGRDDDEFQKEVAIKLVPTVVDRDELLRRFRDERQIMASLEHPNIAHLLDGSTTKDGVPYVVMEYVQGVPIDQYCADKQLSIRETLELFLQVCDALSYAHRHLVVHRDIKPGNIVVTDDGVPKLLDFGIAKILDTEGDQHLTRSGMRLMTPEYASPEQARGEPVNTATDVYSLGVLLYKLLSGELPYKLDTRNLTDVERIICELPVAPPSSVAPGVAAELDDIVLMALRKEPARRYGTVDALAGDVRRFLTKQPITARPDTKRYRIAKFVSRNRLGVTAAGLVFVALLAGISVAMIGLQRAQEAEAQARKEAEISKGVSEAFTDMFATADRYNVTEREMTVEELLDQALENMLDNVKDQPEALGTMLFELGKIYLEAGFKDKGRAAYAEAATVLEGMDEPPKDLLFKVYRASIFPRDMPEAETVSRIADLERWQQTWFPDSSFHRAEVSRMKAYIARAAGRHEEALRYFLEEDAERAVLHRENYQRSSLLGDITDEQFYLGQYEAALATQQQGLELLERDPQPDVEDWVVQKALAYRALSRVQAALGNAEEAISAAEEGVKLADAAYTDFSGTYLIALGFHANTLRMFGRFEEAEELFDKIFRIYQRMQSEGREYDRRLFSDFLNDAAIIQAALGHSESAETYYLQVLEIDRAVHGENAVATLITYFNLACNATLAGWHDKALSYLQIVVDNEYPYNDLEEDSDLDSLRDLPEFQELLERHQAYLAMLDAES